MSWDEVRDEKEGYVRVRKSEDQSLAGRLKKANDDSEAKGYIELNKEDLGGMGGGSGPHNHSEYASKTHTHDDFANAQDLADHLANHPQGGGDPYDDTKVKEDIAKNRQKIDNIQLGQNSQDAKISSLEQDKADKGHTHDGLEGESYDDSWIQPALDGKSDEDHVHDPAEAFDPTALEEKDAEQDARLDALEAQAHEHDGCGNVLGHFMNTWNTSANGGADARDYNIKLHKPSNIKGGEGGDLDDVDVWETTENLQAGDIVYFKVGDDVYEREFSRRMALQYYYDLSFTEKVDFIPKDAEFFIMDNPECEEEIPEHDHEGMVVSESVTTIVRLTEAEYEALADKDPSTLYLVV